MKKHRIFTTAAIALCAGMAMLAPCAAVAANQNTGPGGANTSMTSDLDSAKAPERKLPSVLLHRPKYKNAAAQFRHAASLETNKHYRAAGRAYNALVHKWHNSKYAPAAQIGYARTLALRNKRIRAFSEYQYAAENYSGLVPFSDIIERQYELANEMKSEMNSGFLGFGHEAGPRQVAKLYKHILSNAPAWEHAAECMMLMADCQRADNDLPGAISTREKIAAAFPASPLVADAAYVAAADRRDLSMKNRRDERTLRNALAASRAAVRDFPRHAAADATRAEIAALEKRLADMNFDKANFYDRIRKNPSAALIAYREFIKEFPESEHADFVDERIKDLRKTVALNSIMEYKGSGNAGAQPDATAK